MKMDHPQKMGESQPSPRGESRFLSNTAALAIHTLFATVVTFLQVKILATYLSKDTFGLFVSLRGLSLLVATLAASGFPQLLVRFFPELETKRRREAVLWLYGVSLISSLVFLLVAFFVVSGEETYFFAFLSALDLTKTLLFWFWITTIGWTLKLIVYGGLNGIRRLTIHAVLDVTALFAQLAWIFIEREALSLTMLFKITGVVSLAEAVVGALVILTFLLRNPAGHGTTASGKQSFWVEIRRYGSYWGWAVGLSVVAIAFTDVDRYLLSKVITLEMLALFHIGSRIMRLANRLLGVPNFAFQPEVTRINAEGRTDQTIVATSVFIKFSATVSVLVAAALIAFAGEIITIVANAGYTGSAPLLVLLTLSIPLSAMTAPLTSVMKALEKVRSALYCDLVWALSYVSLLFVLCLRFDLIGAGLAQLFACMAQLLLATRLSQVPLTLRFVAVLGVRLVFCGCVAFAPLFFVEIIFGWTSPGLLTVLKVVLFAVAVVIYRKMVHNMNVVGLEEKRILHEMFEKRGLGAVAKLALGRLDA